MIKVIAGVRRMPGMTHGEYLAYIETVHGRIAREHPLQLDGYIQSHIFDGAFGQAGAPYPSFFHRDSITELYFADMKSLGENFSHPYTQDVVRPDGHKFSDMFSSLSLLTTEETIQAPPAPGQGVKVMHFLKASASRAEDFNSAWKAAEEVAIDAVPELRDRLRGHVRSTALPPKPAGGEGGGADHFGGGDMPQFDGVTSLWFEGESDLPLFRRWEAALLSRDLLDPSVSFFVYAREVPIIDLAAGIRP